MRYGFIILIATLTMGCAGNQALRSQVQEQDRQIAALKAELASSKKENDNCSVQGAWNWITQHSNEAWNSQTSQDVRARLNKLLEDLKKPSDSK